MINKPTYTLIELLELLKIATETNADQSVINNLAYELVCRIYIPFSDMSFDDMLLEYGYVNQREKVK